MNTYDNICESNEIEGIFRDPSEAEIKEHERLCSLEEIGIGDLVEFVSVYQAGARLRNRPGMDVIVGGFVPEAGGPEVPRLLQSIVDAANEKLWTPWEIHTEFECLHPFTDGNGRCGRAFWWWCMRKNKVAQERTFLHTWYYQTLRHYEDQILMSYFTRSKGT